MTNPGVPTPLPIGGPRRLGNARSKKSQIERISAHQRQVVDQLPVESQAGRCVFNLGWRFILDQNAFASDGKPQPCILGHAPIHFDGNGRDFEEYRNPAASTWIE